MKKLYVPLIVSLFALSLIACASRPDWVSNPPTDGYHGMGMAQMDNEARAWQAATNRARQDLAYQLRTSVENMQVDYGNVTGTSNGADFFSSVSRQLSDLVLSGAQVIKRGVGPNKTYYVLVSYPTEELRNAVISASQGEAARNTEFQAEQALKAMDTELAKKRASAPRDYD
ncbi:MAG: LPP20 family lipoprotein [Treponema sp.]|jgi:hypothetical protein|nr:LPP20 family lipoprotein [Treponema sp.]